jgi:hypothetical protein
MRTLTLVSLLGLAVMAVGGAPLHAQEAAMPDVPLRPVRLHADASLIYAHPVGEFADHIDRGYGVAVGTTVPLRQGSPLSLRVDAGAINYGHETQQVCLSSTVGCRVRVDLTTTNNILFLGFGPQLAVPDGPVQPYLHLAAGMAYFGTSSSLRGLDDHRHFAMTVNQDDVSFAWGGGGGLRLGVAAGAVPVQINLGVRYHNNGRVEYLREGDITDRPDGSIVLDPQHSRADLLTFHVGASVGIRPRQATMP